MLFTTYFCGFLNTQIQFETFISFFQHLNRIEEQVLESLAWTAVSCNAICYECMGQSITINLLHKSILYCCFLLQDSPLLTSIGMTADPHVDSSSG